MQTETKIWIDNFNSELVHIQLEFDSFFTAGKIEDYFKLKIDSQTGMLTIVILNNSDLPKAIADALIAAFVKSKPDEL